MPRVLKKKFAGNPGIPYWLATLNYGIAEAQMIVEWCDQTIPTLDKLERDGKSSGATDQGRRGRTVTHEEFYGVV